MIEPSKAAQELALRIARHYPTEESCFDGRVYQDAALIEELIAARALGLSTPIEHIAGASPVVLFFGTDADREEFIEAVKQAKPGMQAYKI